MSDGTGPGDDYRWAVMQARNDIATFDRLAAFVNGFMPAFHTRVATEELGENEDVTRKRDTEAAYAGVPRDVRNQLESALVKCLDAIGRHADRQFQPDPDGDQP